MTAAQSWGQANEFEKAQELEIASAAAAGPNAEQRLVNAAVRTVLRARSLELPANLEMSDCGQLCRGLLHISRLDEHCVQRHLTGANDVR